MGVKKQKECVRAGLALGCVSAVLWYQCYHQEGGITPLRLVTGCGGCMCLLLSAVAVDMARRRPADSHSLVTLLSQYTFSVVLSVYGSLAYRRFTKTCTDMAPTQTDILLNRFITPNINTEFGRKHDFKNIRSREDYRRKVPLSTYDDYRPYIQRVVDNPHDLTAGLLFAAPVEFLAVTSGSTGRNKVIPIPQGLRSQGLVVKALMHHTVSRTQAGGSLLRQFRLGYRPAVERSPSGLLQAPISFHMTRHLPHSLLPPEVYSIQDEQTALYVEAVLALAEREVGSIVGFMSTLVWAFWRVIEQNWKQMCDDIERGSLSQRVQIEPHIRAAVEKQLVADPARAQQLRVQFRQGQKQLFKRIWPEYQYTTMFATGGFSHYAQILMNGVLNDSMLFSPNHCASEGVFGAQLWPNHRDPLDISYVAFTMLFQEYLPVIEESQSSGDDSAQTQTLFPEELKVGECYEVVSTSPMGLYRYRMGDVIKVVDFHGQCPIYEFQYRTGHVLNVFWEKTPENVFYDALVASCAELGLTLVDYTTTEDVSMVPIPEYVPNSDCKHYVLFLEATRENGSPASLTQEERAVMDRQLCDRMELYRVLRGKSSIGPLHVVEVNQDTFSLVRALLLEGLNSQQLKMPRVVRDKRLLHRLVLARHKEEAG